MCGAREEEHLIMGVPFFGFLFADFLFGDSVEIVPPSSTTRKKNDVHCANKKCSCVCVFVGGKGELCLAQHTPRR